METENKNFIQTEQEVLSEEEKKLPISKLFVLGGISFALSGTGFFPFAPIPLVHAFLLYGRNLTLGVIGGVALLVGIPLLLMSLNKLMYEFLLISGVLFLVSSLFSYLTSRTFDQGDRPGVGIVRSGVFVIGFVVCLFVGHALMADSSAHQQLVDFVEKSIPQLKETPFYQETVARGDDNSRALKEAIGSPTKLVDSFFSYLPTFVIVPSFFIFFLTHFLVLLNSYIWKKRIDYPYSLNDLINFKVRDELIYVVILGLALVLGGEYIMKGSFAQVIGENLIYCMGVFYLFQGAGISWEFLGFLRIKGFLRLVLFMFSLLVAWRLLALVGLFDLWVNFKRFFKNKHSNEGDTQ